MSDDLLEHNFMVDMENDYEPSYIADDVQWNYINDIMYNNYPQGYINFNNVSIAGNSVSKYFAWSEAYLQIPYYIQCAFQGDGNTPATTVVNFDPTFSYKYAIAPKPFHHFIDKVSVKFNGVDVNHNSTHNNFYQNERLKMMNEDEKKVIGDLINLSWDSGNTINFTDAIGEFNNITNGTNPLSLGVTETSQTNRGHVERCQRNTDMFTQSNSMNKFTQLGTSLLTNEYQSGIYSVTTAAGGSGSTLVYNGMAYIPLKYVCDFFDKLPTVSSSLGFQLSVQLNVAKENSYLLQYDVVANGYNLLSVVANQNVGRTCPFMISPASVSGSSGLKLTTTGAPGASRRLMTVTNGIGWSGAAAPPARIYIPAINYTPRYTEEILKKPQCMVTYRDYYVDTDFNKKGGDTVQRLFNAQIAKVRNLYIIPFISTGTNLGVTIPCSPFSSPVSSAPITCSPCKLKNIQVQIGGQNIFTESQQFNNQLYTNSFLHLMAHVNGNSLKGKDFGCQITKTMWELGGYNTFVINIKKVSDAIADSLSKSFQILYTIDAPNTVFYDFLYIIDYEGSMNLDRSTGEILPLQH